MKLEYKPGGANVVVDSLSRAQGESCAGVCLVSSENTEDPVLAKVQREQQQDEELADLIRYLERRVLPDCQIRRQKVLSASQRGYYVVDGVLYFKSIEVPDRHRLVVSAHLRQRIVEENHDPIFAGHFSVKKLSTRKAEEGILLASDEARCVSKMCKLCGVCISAGQERKVKPPLKSIQVGRPFECVRMDFKQMDVSHSWNRYALVLQDYLTKWPKVYQWLTEQQQQWQSA